MRITLEPTDVDNTHQHTIIIESPGDDQDIGATIELIRAALLAWGFQPKTLDEWIGVR